MKIRIIAILFVLSLTSLTAYSQVRFGIKGGIDVIDHKPNFDMLKVSNRLGYQVGASLELMAPVSGFGLELSALYGRKEYDVETKLLDVAISDHDYISVPLVLKKRFGITSMLGIFISAGGFIDFNINGGDFKIDEIDQYVDKFKAKDFEAGATAGAGLQLFKNFDLGMYYRATLTDKYAIEDPDWNKLNDKKYQTWTVGLTYFF